ncbi:integrase [Yersinia pseudotuberculosis]|uniref:Integrase n=1 Tax=Yersinia pseudotuberculosis TaxID=633 RepID=A0A2A7VGV2_YERPU|nr:phage integrase Arm DNA-binding domain-containing protein [Yersinia pseudotuberculosis]AIN13126.1 phage integrase family protein [Yersinia pseudotuberculosis]AXY33477.1 integrase [Yersinia pseudotuberculosis]AYW92797.1 integrase [Yersinia pseudotuberculosis]AYX13169.1 integrase [Yersinia pseudotuberculosis]MBO1561573.1 tyrosine-type recombinase/integrase [Yersinia pseudotuberculosis]
MARPRKYNINVPGLSCYTDARTKKVYWRYKHPITRKFHGLGDDESAAKAIAIEANSRFANQQMGQLLKARDEISLKIGKAITVNTWLDRYLAIQQERYDSEEIKLNTLKQKNAPVEAFRRHCGMLTLPDVGARDIASVIEEYKDKGQKRMAQVVRMVLIDVYKEAQHSGEVPPGYNPALATKQPTNKVTRIRLNFDEWESIFNAAANMQGYIQNAMLLALVTGQRLGDIADMKFSDVWDNHLHIVQEKTGTRIAIPITLKCESVGYTLQDVIARCRNMIVSPYMLHYHHTTSMAKRGGQVSSNAITTGFSAARDKSGLQWKDGTPPTFHEQRSLAERLYREQGVDTKTLLGHKNQAMTDKYNDDRGKEWLVLAV